MGTVVNTRQPPWKIKIRDYERKLSVDGVSLNLLYI